MSQARERGKAGLQPRRRYGELKGAKPRMFRASPDVGELLDREVDRTGQTQSAIIDEGLRRAFWSEERYMETLVRNFGGRAAFARAYLLNRIAVGVEHDARAKGLSETEIAAQVAAAQKFVIDQFAAVSIAVPRDGRHDAIVQRANGTKEVVEIKATRSQVSAEKQLVEIANALAAMRAARPTSLEPWQLIVLTIDRNLTRGGELWWPLSDVPETDERTARHALPLRPSLVDLRAAWPIGDR